MRKFAFVALVAGWMACGIGSAKAAAMPQGGGGTTVTVNNNGSPATGATFALDISNMGKTAHSTGTVDSNGTPSNALDLSNVGKVRVDVYVEVCQNGQHILVVNSGVVVPDDGTCHNRTKIGTGWVTGSGTIKIDTGTGTVDFPNSGTSTGTSGGETGGFTPWEAFGGYEFLRYREEGEGYNFSGFATSLLYDTNSWLGLGFAYDYKKLTGEKESASVQFYGGAVQLNDRMKTVTPFAEAQIGGAHFSAGGETTNSFAMKFGGGVDVNVTPHIGIRLFQMDWVYTHFGGESENSFDYVAGVNFKLGAPK